jgi:hypothetical protein
MTKLCVDCGEPLDRCECELPCECCTCGTQCDQEGICLVCAALERAEERWRVAVTAAEARAAKRAIREAKAVPIDSCRKCGAPLTLGDVVDGRACTDAGEGEEEGRVFVYCSEHCRETH